MIFNKAFLPSDYDSMVVLTDMEPDDTVALAMIFGKAEKIGWRVPTIVVVGEGSCNKVETTEKLLMILGVNDWVRVVQGPHSTSNYPAACLKAFDCDSYNENRRPITKFRNINKNEGISPYLTEFLTVKRDPLMVMLKPSIELLDLSIPNLAKSTLVCYGGFNFRKMYEDTREDIKYYRTQLASFLNSSCKKVIVFENFHAYGNNVNTISFDNSPGLMQMFLIHDTSPLINGIRKMMNGWNDHILFEKTNSLAKKATNMSDIFFSEEKNYSFLKEEMVKMSRTMKVIQSVINGEGLQMVAADFGLIAVLFEDSGCGCTIVPGTIEFDSNGYTQIIEEENSKLELIEDVDFIRMSNIVKKSLEELIQE